MGTIKLTIQIKQEHKSNELLKHCIIQEILQS